MCSSTPFASLFGFGSSGDDDKKKKKKRGGSSGTDASFSTSEVSFTTSARKCCYSRLFGCEVLRLVHLAVGRTLLLTWPGIFSETPVLAGVLRLSSSRDGHFRGCGAGHEEVETVEP